MLYFIRALFLVFVFAFISCNGSKREVAENSGVESKGDSQTTETKADCPLDKAPSSADLKQKKEQLFAGIRAKSEDETKTAETLSSYQSIIDHLQKTACPQDVEKVIENLSKQHSITQ